MTFVHEKQKSELAKLPCKKPCKQTNKKARQICYYTLEWRFCRTLCSDVNPLLWVGWPHMVTVFSAFLQLRVGPAPPPLLHAGHMPSVWTVSKWLHMCSVWLRGSVCRSPLPPNQKQELARSGPVGGWRSPGRSLTDFHQHSHSSLTNLDFTSKPIFCLKGAILTSQL